MSELCKCDFCEDVETIDVVEQWNDRTEDQ